MFQFYILARLVNPGLLGGLNEDIYGSKEPYKVVIRQMGRSFMQVIFLDTCEVFKIKVNSLIFDNFDSKTMLYLFEPGLTVDEPLENNGCATILTVSPNERRCISISFFCEPHYVYSFLFTLYYTHYFLSCFPFL